MGKCKYYFYFFSKTKKKKTIKTRDEKFFQRVYRRRKLSEWGIQTRIKSSCKSTCLDLVAEFALGALSRKSTLQVPGEKKQLVISLGYHHV